MQIHVPVCNVVNNYKLYMLAIFSFHNYFVMIISVLFSLILFMRRYEGTNKLKILHVTYIFSEESLVILVKFS